MRTIVPFSIAMDAGVTPWGRTTRVLLIVIKLSTAASSSPRLRIKLSTTEGTQGTRHSRTGSRLILHGLRALSGGELSVNRGGAFHDRVARFRNDPLPARPTNLPFSMTRRPRDRTVSVAPVTWRPSYGL